MHKSRSVSRQGTFDTGLAQPDKRGSIRKGDIELPIVGDVKHSSTDKSHNDSGFCSQSPASKAPGDDSSPRYIDHNKLYPDDRWEDREKPLRGPAQRGGRFQADSKWKKDVPNCCSPRQTPERFLSTKDKHEGKASPRRHHTGGQDGSAPEQTKGSAAEQHPLPSRAKVKEERLSVKPAEDSVHSLLDGKEGQTSKSTALSRLNTKGEVKQSVASKPAGRPEKTAADDAKHQAQSPRPGQQKSQQAQQHKQDQQHHKQPKHPQPQQHPQTKQALSPSPSPSEPSVKQQKDQAHSAQANQTSITVDKRHTNDKQESNTNNKTSTSSPRQAPSSVKEQKDQKPPQPQTKETLVEIVREAVSQKGETKRDNKAKTTTPRQSPSSESSVKQQQQPQQHSQKEKQKPQPQKEEQKQEQQPQHQHTTGRAREPVDSQDSESKKKKKQSSDEGTKPNETTAVTGTTHPHSSPSQTPNTPPNPFLQSTYEGKSIPPQDHQRKVSINPTTKKLETPRPKEDKKVQKAAAGEGKNPEPTHGSDRGKSKPSAETAMSTMAEGPRRAQGDSLAQVTAERDQLLRNESTYKQRILQLEEEVKSVVKQSQELSAENRALQNKVEAFETKAYGGSLEIKELRREKQDLVTMVARTTGEKQDAETENERLKSKLSEMDSKSKQWDTIYVENNKLKTKQAELEKRLQDSENDKMKLRNSIATAESSQLDKLGAVQNENKKLQAELINLQTKNSSLERKMERLEQDNKDLVERMNQKKSELEELMRAMKAETNVELELKEANQEIEFAKNKIEDYKRDLDEVNHRYQVLEKEKDSAKNALRLKESECKGLKAASEEKDTQLGELRRQVDMAKRNVKRLEDDLEDTKQVEKDAVNMKARIRSLKNEIEDSLAANHKLKQERTEARLEAERLNRELATASEALSEARRYIKKLEGERGSRDKFEEELNTRRQREQDLERQAFDLNTRNEQLRAKLRFMEDEKEELLKNHGGLTEMEAINRRLQDENKKLRQMLVERNMEIAQRQSERNALANRVDNLERKQQDSDIKMQQLKGWVDTSYSYPAAPATSHQPNAVEAYHHHHHHPVVGLPPVPSRAAPQQTRGGAREDQGGVRRKKSQRNPQQQRQHQLNRSWEDLNRLKVEPEESIRTTPGLPGVSDSKIAQGSGHSPPGYFDLYRSKMKLIRERKW